eukprot:4755856-Amphidinium_carterae.1
MQLEIQVICVKFRQQHVQLETTMSDLSKHTEQVRKELQAMREDQNKPLVSDNEDEVASIDTR